MNGTHVETLRDVSRTLLDLLKTNLTDVAGRIALASPKSAGANLLTLFLYKVTENPDLKNAERLVSQPNGSLVERRAPLSLDAYYLLTAHAGEPPDPLEAHRASAAPCACSTTTAFCKGRCSALTIQARD